MNKKKLISEIYYKTARSSGSGGQHVNKVSSKVILYFNLKESEAFTEDENITLNKNLRNKLNTNGVIQLSCEESRSQFRNKKLVLGRFLSMIEESLKTRKVRKKSSPSRSSVLKAKVKKKHLSEKKSLRRKPKLE